MELFLLRLFNMNSIYNYLKKLSNYYIIIPVIVVTSIAIVVLFLSVKLYINGLKDVPIGEQNLEQYFRINLTDSIKVESYLQDSFGKTQINFGINEKAEVFLFEIEKLKKELIYFSQDYNLLENNEGVLQGVAYTNFSFNKGILSFNILNDLNKNIRKNNIIYSCSEIDSSIKNNNSQVIFSMSNTAGYIFANSEKDVLIKIQNLSRSNTGIIVVNSSEKYRFYFIRFAPNSDWDSAFKTIYQNNIRPVLKTEVDLLN